MRRFVFSLQKVLDYRQRLEEQAIRAFAEAQRQLHNEQAVLEHLLLSREACLNLSHRTHRLTVEMLDVEQKYLSVLEERIQQQHQRIEEAKALLERRRQELIVAQRERKILERLREKQYELWRQELLRAEQKALDDLASVRAVLKPSELAMHLGTRQNE